MAGKALKFVDIKCDDFQFNTSRRVLNTPARVSGREILTARFRLFIVLHIYDSQELRRTIE